LNREAYMPTTTLRRSRRALFIALLPCMLGAQTTHIAVLPPPPGPLGFLTARYRPRTVPAVNLNNSGRLASLVRAGTLYLTAQDAIALTLENNIDLEMQRYGPLMAREDIRRAAVGGALRSPSTPIAPGPQSVSLAGINVSGSMASGAGVGSGGGVTGLLGSFVPQTDPVLSLSASMGHSTTPESNIIVDQTNFLVEGSRDFGVSYSQQFMTGAAFSAYFSASRGATNSPSALLNPANYGSVGLTLTQNLLQGFGASVNTRYIRIARNNAKVTDLQLKQQAITTVSAVLNLYWDLVAFHEDVRLKQQALEAARKLYEDNRKTVEAGGAAAIEITRAQAEIPAREQDVLLARTNVLQQEIVLKNALSRRGIEDPLIADAPIVPLDSIEVPDAEVLPPVAELVAKALAARPDLQQNRINWESQSLVLKGDRSALRPSLQAFASFANHGQAGVPNPGNTGNRYGVPDPYYLGGGGTVLGQLLRRNFPDYAAGVSIAIPIRNRAAQADYAVDQLQARQQELQLEKSVAQVGVDVRNAVIGLRQAHVRYETARRTKILAEETLAAERKKYEYGKSTNALVIQAQRDVVAAESEEVQAMANYTHNRIAFEGALGATFERYHIEMEEAASGRVARESALPERLPGQKDGGRP
jgi:outer membrane protein TolC